MIWIIIKIILAVLMLITGLGVTVLVLMQNSNSEGTAALSGTRSQQDSYLGKNKGRRKEEQFKLWTFIASGIFAVCSIAFFIIGA